MARVRIASLAEIPPGQMFEYTDGDDRFLVCNVDGKLHAVDGTCPHRGGPLFHGALHGATLVCPWHAWEFDCRSGEYDYNPELRLETFRVEVEHGSVYLVIP
ncbi:MAG: Rieske 2Fe-2S domain-containing protein [Bryobacterales bacterium]|nr:Rieske 2Fe-2S domain-containing protein [Bryobacterales bacterium]